MSSSSRSTIVIENDPFLRFLQIVLEPAAPADRVAAFAHFLAHDLPDLSGWCQNLRTRIAGLKTLYGRQLGIVGLGEIGREFALRAAAMGMRIVYFQRHRLADAEEQRYQATYCVLTELLASSDAVSLHLPRGPETGNFIGARELSLIKPGTLLINVAQPRLVEREALRDARASGRLGGYGMDTFYEEPGDANDPLIQFPNVIVTPHLGGSPRFNTLDDFEEVLVNISRALEQR